MFLAFVAGSRNEAPFLLQTSFRIWKRRFNAEQADTIPHDARHWLIADAEIKRNAGSIRRPFIATYSVLRLVYALASVCRATIDRF